MSKAECRVSWVASLLLLTSVLFSNAAIAAEPGWHSRSTGNIVHGPGSYYTTEKDVTREFEGIKTEAAAWKKVLQLAKENPSNPPVMWQLSNFPGEPDGHLIVHFKKFMSKRLDRETGYSVDCYTAFHAEYGKKNVHPVRVDGFSPPMHYLPDPAETKRSCKTDSYSADGCPFGTANLTYGGFAAGAEKLRKLLRSKLVDGAANGSE